jgi:hypothetical protein
VNDIPDPLLGSGLERRPVLCGGCGTAWDERLVSATAVAAHDSGLCPSCLLLVRHGEQPPVAVASALVDPYPTALSPVVTASPSAAPGTA